jgi:hypothetical protein
MTKLLRATLHKTTFLAPLLRKTHHHTYFRHVQAEKNRDIPLQELAVENGPFVPTNIGERNPRFSPPTCNGLQSK